MFRLEENKELDEATLGKFLAKHTEECTRRYKILEDAYRTDYEIFRQPKKPAWKPDNRIAVNFAKYIVDTMNGFFIGNPIKVSCDEEKIAEYVEFLGRYSGQDDQDAELSKVCSIYGKGYEMYYVDETGTLSSTCLKPTEAFMIYDDSVLKRVRYFVRLYLDSDNILHGSVSDSERVRYFEIRGKLQFLNEYEKEHFFDGVPAVKYVENEEEMGIFEPILSMINAYNKAISEKANDVDYFADAYLKVLGTLLDEDEVKHIRDDRIINFDGDTEKMIVEFLQKPDGDTTQEHLIDRLERLIFQISMVANISDENFGTSSGIALRYKLLSMLNLAKTKERKFTAGMEQRYRLLFSHPVSAQKVGKDDWVKLRYKFSPNIPANILEESQIAGNLEGIVSKETQLETLSIVDNVKIEKERIKKEEDEAKANGSILGESFVSAVRKEGIAGEQE